MKGCESHVKTLGKESGKDLGQEEEANTFKPELKIT